MQPYRVLVIDDNHDIHKDYRKALDHVAVKYDQKKLRDLEMLLFDEDSLPDLKPEGSNFDITSAFQGEEGYATAIQARLAGKPFSMAFVDVRMPPGLDGIQTTRRLLVDDPDLEIVLCSAYSDYPWERINEILGVTDRVLFLRKPFDTIEVKQMTEALCFKWRLRQENARNAELMLAAKEEAIAASNVKTQFISNMSHEIRTPLNGVIGMAYLLRQTKLDDEQKEYVETINYSARILLDLINNILDFSKIESNKLMLEEVVFRLPELIYDLRSLFGPMAKSRGLTLEIEVAEAVPEWVCGDPIRVRQVLINLLANAVKFTESGGIWVNVSLASIQNETCVIKAAIRDSGIGIGPEGMAQMFQSFNQVDASTTRKYGGTGLGLAISKMLAQLLGGTLEVESCVGEGSTFTFSFGVVKAEAKTELVSAPIHSEMGQRSKILVAEDNKVNQKVVAQILHKAGYQTVLAENGLEVLDAYHKGEFALILMDCQMPEMDGFEATRQIRIAEKGKSHVPILALTANAVVGDRERCLAAGMDDYITKPVQGAELLGMIQRMLMPGSG